MHSRVHHFRNSKVANFDDTILTQEYICRFEISAKCAFVMHGPVWVVEMIFDLTCEEFFRRAYN